MCENTPSFRIIDQIQQCEPFDDWNGVIQLTQVRRLYGIWRMKWLCGPSRHSSNPVAPTWCNKRPFGEFVKRVKSVVTALEFPAPGLSSASPATPAATNGLCGKGRVSFWRRDRCSKWWPFSDWLATNSTHVIYLLDISPPVTVS